MVSLTLMSINAAEVQNVPQQAIITNPQNMQVPMQNMQGQMPQLMMQQQQQPMQQDGQQPQPLQGPSTQLNLDGNVPSFAKNNNQNNQMQNNQNQGQNMIQNNMMGAQNMPQNVNNMQQQGPNNMMNMQQNANSAQQNPNQPSMTPTPPNTQQMNSGNLTPNFMRGTPPRSNNNRQLTQHDSVGSVRSQGGKGGNNNFGMDRQQSRQSNVSNNSAKAQGANAGGKGASKTLSKEDSLAQAANLLGATGGKNQRGGPQRANNMQAWPEHAGYVSIFSTNIFSSL